MHAWAFPLAAWNFSSQKSLSPFLAWANTSGKEHTTYCDPIQLDEGAYFYFNNQSFSLAHCRKIEIIETYPSK